jgi:alkylation response protein AidB-like acyl-CoA dehydrogenase
VRCRGSISRAGGRQAHLNALAYVSDSAFISTVSRVHRLWRLPFAPDDYESMDDEQRARVRDFARQDGLGTAVEEWKLYSAAALGGLGREALRLGAAYACERKAFGQLIGTFQGISHPLADLLCDVDGAKFLVWRAIRRIFDKADDAATSVSVALWFAADAAVRAASQSLHTFGGYGLSTEYDIHLFVLRAKEWPLVWGDPQTLGEEAGRRRYGGETVSLPEPGEVPIDFDLGDEARAIVAELRQLFDDNVTDAEREKFHYSWEGYNPRVHKLLADNHLLFPGFPEEISGRSIPAYARIAAMGELEHQGYNTPAANVAAMVAMMIWKYGSDELKRDVLPRITGGEAICSLGYSEPGSGSDVFAAQCKATPDGNGWRIDGTKMWTSGANLSEYVLMLARTNTEVAKHKGLTMFIVPLKTEGVTVQAVHTFMNERTNITFYDGVKIPDTWRLGEVDGGIKTMSAALEMEHGGGFSKVIDAMLRAAEELCRDLPKNGRPLIEDIGAQVRLTRTLGNLWVSDMLAFRAQWASVEKKPTHAFGPMSKMYSSEKFLSDSRDLLDLTAPASLSKRSGPAAFLNQCFRHAHGTTIYGGTSEVHRSMVAEKGLGLPRTRG